MQATESGELPARLDVRLERRDRNPLPPEALLKFQVINRGKDPTYNYRWVLYLDGRWFLAKHSGDTSDWQTPFDTELPITPTKTLKAEAINEVTQQLRQADFLTSAPYWLNNSVEDGTFYVVTAQLDGKMHEVIYEAASTPLTDFLEAFTNRQASPEAKSRFTWLAKLRP